MGSGQRGQDKCDRGQSFCAPIFMSRGLGKGYAGGPWVFREKTILIAPCDGFTKPSSIELNIVLVWIQIYDLPDGYEELAKLLVGQFGEFVLQEAPSSNFVGNFYIIREKLMCGSSRRVGYPLSIA